MIPGVTVVPLTADRIPEAVRIMQDCFPGGPGEASLAADFENPDHRWFMAVTEGVLAGIGGGYTAADQADIIDVAVLPAYRRRGIARALMRAVMTAAAADGAETVFLEVRASNVPAIALYESLGFAKCGLRKNYYASPREDAVLMQCPLPVGTDTK